MVFADDFTLIFLAMLKNQVLPLRKQALTTQALTSQTVFVIRSKVLDGVFLGRFKFAKISSIVFCFSLLEQIIMISGHSSDKL